MTDDLSQELLLDLGECGSAYAGRFELELAGVHRPPSPEFIEAVKAMAGRLKIREPLWILAVMDHESGINAQAENPYSKAIGLIQFIKSTAKSLGTSLDALKAMSALEQLVYVEKYFKNFTPLRSATDVAAAVFYPRAIGDMSYIIGRKGEKTYDWNAALDKDKKGFITIVDYMRSLRKFGWRWGIEMSDIDSYLDSARKAESFQALQALNERMLSENPKSADAQAAFTRFRDTLAKIVQKVSASSKPVFDGVDYRELMVSKIRGAFRVQSDYSPSVKDYAQAALQTAVDVGDKATQVATSLPDSLSLLGAGAVVVIAAGLFLRAKGRA